jgi:hypothetical protein
MQTWNFDQWFNFIEGLWWISLGSGMTYVTVNKKILRKMPYACIVLLVLFGISDFVEIHTGAWWCPWWLLAWKAGCIVAGIICLILYFRKGDSYE